MKKSVILFIFIAYVSGGFAAPAESKLTISCASCQLVAHLVTPRSLNESGPDHLISKYAIDRHCSKIDSCSTVYTQCEIVTKLSQSHIELPGNNTNIHKAALEKSLKKFFLEASQACIHEPNKAVITSNDQSIKCSMCILIYNFFSYFNTAILENPMLKYIPAAVNITCFMIKSLTGVEQPAMCGPLTQGNAIQDILKGIQDSLGGFYDLIAVQGMGCYPYQQLFNDCGY